jgi:hypothetical protein
MSAISHWSFGNKKIKLKSITIKKPTGNQLPHSKRKFASSETLCKVTTLWKIKEKR